MPWRGRDLKYQEKSDIQSNISKGHWDRNLIEEICCHAPEEAIKGQRYGDMEEER
jgi:hypothetical protein